MSAMSIDSSSSPSAANRPDTSTTSSYNNSGLTISRAKMSGRFWYAMRRTSRNPRVVTSSVRSPFRSNSALVATVVPILTAPMRSPGMASLLPIPINSRMPCSAASRYASGFSESSFIEFTRPDGSRATTSVKVPPRSIQNSHFPSVVAALAAFELDPRGDGPMLRPNPPIERGQRRQGRDRSSRRASIPVCHRQCVSTSQGVRGLGTC